MYRGCAGYGCGLVFFFQAEDGIRDLVRSRGLGDVYKRQVLSGNTYQAVFASIGVVVGDLIEYRIKATDNSTPVSYTHLTLPTSDLV